MPGTGAHERREDRGLARGVLSVAAVGMLVVLGVWPSVSEAEPAVEVALPDSGLTVTEVVRVVRAAAEAEPAATPGRDVTVVFTDVVPGAEEAGLVAGRQRGSTVWVRVQGLAAPTRTLVHELAHVLVPGDGHGEGFRAVYLAAFEEIFGVERTSREARRLAWVYDRCYRDGSCPAIRRG
jgi:hypothetical protein